MSTFGQANWLRVRLLELLIDKPEALWWLADKEVWILELIELEERLHKHFYRDTGSSDITSGRSGDVGWIVIRDSARLTGDATGVYNRLMELTRGWGITITATGLVPAKTRQYPMLQPMVRSQRQSYPYEPAQRLDTLI